MGTVVNLHSKMKTKFFKSCQTQGLPNLGKLASILALEASTSGTSTVGLKAQKKKRGGCFSPEEEQMKKKIKGDW
ncbi:hypothetical protein ACLOJK_027590 [Asimina triloba]